MLNVGLFVPHCFLLLQNWLMSWIVDHIGTRNGSKIHPHTVLSSGSVWTQQFYIESFTGSRSKLSKTNISDLQFLCYIPECNKHLSISFNLWVTILPRDSFFFFFFSWRENNIIEIYVKCCSLVLFLYCVSSQVVLPLPMEDKRFSNFRNMLADMHSFQLKVPHRIWQKKCSLVTHRRKPVVLP